MILLLEFTTGKLLDAQVGSLSTPGPEKHKNQSGFFPQQVFLDSLPTVTEDSFLFSCECA